MRIDVYALWYALCVIILAGYAVGFGVVELIWRRDAIRRVRGSRV